MIIKIKESELIDLLKKVINEQVAQTSTVPFMTKDTQKTQVTDINPYKLKLGNGGKKDPKNIEKVNQLQQKLIDLGYLKTDTGKPTGYFGPLTQQALNDYFNKKPTSTTKLPKNKFIKCVGESPKGQFIKTKGVLNNTIKIDDNYYYINGRVTVKQDNKYVLGTYYCYGNGVIVKLDSGEKLKFDTGVKTEREESGTFEGGLSGFLRRKFSNVAQILFTKPLTGKDFSESQKKVVFDVIQNAIYKRNQDKKKGCTEYIDYSPEIDQQLNKNGGASTMEMALGSGFSDEFRVATLLGRFCYQLQSDGSYIVTDDYDFHKWKEFTVKKEELEGKSYPEKIGYIMDKTGLSPYGAIRHLGWLEHPDNAPAATKTKISLIIQPGYFVKNKSQTSNTNIA
jgi:hypothetical protein